MKDDRNAGQNDENVTGPSDEMVNTEENEKAKSHDQSDAVDHNNSNDMDRPLAPGTEDNKTEKEEVDTERDGQKDDKTCYRLMFRPCINLFNGWSVYIRQPVVYAGVSLACLFMTVLGFDSITVGK